MSSAETTPRSIKQHIKDGDKVNHIKLPTNASREQVHELIAEHAPDMLYLDAHHSPVTEWDISRICQAGQEKDTPVMMRIKHAHPASLISGLLDIGVFSIKVPTVEDEATVDAVIDAFYYPPIGKRSLGGSNNYGEVDRKLGPDGSPYFEWWNNNAVLGFKLETLKGVLHARYLAKPGVDYFDFGGQDLGHDLAIQQHPGFETVAACKDFVTHAPQGTGVSFGLAGRAGQRL
ncbi:MAG: aldolase/citrate lyase family protein [Candidatus Latescibacteria bacterium]|nr:aldolase/citrate lyase family protein [Candidatus Latescibacterota bacterium]MDP7450121.1 aldolase/citrate lyase family protein [Candidatus Latescibacterota bacterium]HJP32470.1 aldolase/citrate lyase family protein [Candidatus Latescibacterota bacterium]